MLSPAEFRAITSGQRRGVRAALWRGLFGAASLGYGLGVRWRNARFDRGAGVQRAGVPVVSVGNLTLGGTGKTPAVAWIARRLREHGKRVTILSRGYHAEDGANDEALELEERLPDVPHLQDADRAAMSRVAVEEFEAEALLLDDGFQHRRLARDLDIVLVNALDPWGGGRLFPRGMLREPVASLARADVVVLTHADQIAEAARREIAAAVRRHAPSADWCEARHAPRSLLASGGGVQPIDALRGARVAAFCGIGNPAAFRRSLEDCGATVQALREFPDHHPFDRADVDSLRCWAAEQDAALIVCTHKDLVKLGIDQLGGKPLAALAIELEFLLGAERMAERLRNLPWPDSPLI